MVERSLIFEARSFPCGYAPRSILLAADRDALFVGCKDGSITALERETGANPADCTLEDFQLLQVVPPGGLESGIRALCEWDERHLLAGLSDGTVWKVPLYGNKQIAKKRVFKAGAEEGPVRAIARVGEEGFVIAFRSSGRFLSRKEESQQLRFRRGVRFVVPLERRQGGQDWLLITDRGELSLWDGNPVHDPVDKSDPWSERYERPGILNDFGMLRNDRGRAARKGASGIFLATDSGVYLLRLKDDSEVSCWRLALPGVGAMATALTYTEDPQGAAQRRRYLWVADSRGDSHLFVAELPPLEPNEGDGDLHFRRSGVRHARSEVLLCSLWARGRPTSLFFGQARGKDQIVLGRYWDPREDLPESEKDLPLHPRLRCLLSHGWWDARPGVTNGLSQDREERLETLRNELLKALNALAGRIPQDRWREDYGAEEWPLEALLTELFECLGEEEELRDLLIDAIRSRECEIAKEILTSGSEDLVSATRMWTQALLGVIHRSEKDRELAYLGLLRWLRRRQEEVAEQPQRGASLVASLQKDISFARKWGLHGATLAEREDLVGPIKIHRQQKRAPSYSSRPEDSDEATASDDDPLMLELLTYEASLLHRSANLVDRYDKGRLRGRTAWDVYCGRLPGWPVVAVSWMWGGVEVYELQNEPDPESGSRLRPAVAFRPEPHQEGERIEIETDFPWSSRKSGWDVKNLRLQKHLYSRVVLVGETQDQAAFLLAAPTRPDSDTTAEEILLWQLPRDGYLSYAGQDDPDPLEATRVELEKGESVYSVHPLTPEWMVLGLRGRGGQAKLALLQVTSSGEGLNASLEELIRLERGGESQDAARSTRRNRVWSLASDPQVSGSNCQGNLTLLAGCEGGQIYRVMVSRDENGRLQFHESVRNKGAELVGRLGSPVRALAYREFELPYARVYAGGEDGNLVAWEELGKPRTESGFATLWATQEEGPVADLHTLAVVDEPKGTKESSATIRREFVLAVTRQGRTVLLDDRSMIEAGDDDPSRPHRDPVPGSRFGRVRLPGTAFASKLLASDEFSLSLQARELGAYTAVLTAAGDGVLRLVSLHTPTKSGIREKRYSEVLSLWEEVRRSNVDWRLCEAVYRAVPILDWIVVRWLLDPSFPPDWPGPTPPGFMAWWLPRHLRPLREVRLGWDRLVPDDRQDRANGERITYQKADEIARKIGNALFATLERAWQLNDLSLYQEICALALKKANFTVYALIPKEIPMETPENWLEQKMRIERLYSEVYGAIETSLHSWLGSANRGEARARAVVAKHMVDGDTMWKVVLEIGREKRRPEEEPQGSFSSPFNEILKRRVNGVRELVHKRDSMVSLEALRAANLSLTRLCKRLVKERRERHVGDASNYRPNPGLPLEEVEVYWPGVFEDYFERLTTAAARTFHARRELTDAIAHEYSRTFALCICAAPSATIRISNRMAEALLIRDLEADDDLSRRVLRQLDVLAQIGLECPIWARDLFRHVTGLPKPEYRFNPACEAAIKDLGLTRCPREADDKEIRGQIGDQNTEDLFALTRLYKVVAYFVVLAESLSNNAVGIDLSPHKLQCLGNQLEREQKEQDPYHHSIGFWTESVQELSDRLATRRQPDSEDSQTMASVDRDRIRPEVVLLSQEIAIWARERIERLSALQRERELFLPELAIFRQVLDNLRQAAEGFRTSAAVHKNIVRGIMGHHLLENLDEHVLELEEMAQALDPITVERLREGRQLATQDPSSLSTAQRFALYLIRRSRGAQSIPKNLRVLHALLSAQPRESAEERPREQSEDRVKPDLRSLLYRYRSGPLNRRSDWDLGSLTEPISVSEAALKTLSLTLEELAQNQARYSGLEPWPDQVEGLPRPDPMPSPRVVPLNGDTETLGICLEFPFRALPQEDEAYENLLRLKELKGRAGLQRPFRPRDRDVASTGAGLYLANLAAAVVGWELWIEEVNCEAKNPVAWCSFVLQRWDRKVDAAQ